LVLHGASDVPENDVKRAIELGISKVNFATELRAALTEGVREALEDKSIFDPKVYLNRGKKVLKETVKQKILMCGSFDKIR
jgi:tagatose 1,6-diphosphate aldolase GatY/KbaY